MTNPKNVLEVLIVSSKFHPEYSGSGFRAEQLYRRLGDQFRVRSRVLCGSVEFGDHQTFQLDEFTVTRIATSKNKWVAGTRGVFIHRLIVKTLELAEFFHALKALHKTKPQLIHAFGKSSVVSAAVYWARLRKIPLILELCNRMEDPHVDAPLISSFYRPRLDRLTVLIPISNELRDLCSDFGYSANVWCRPNPVRPEIQFVSDNKRTLNKKISKLHCFSDKKRLVYVAKFMPQKNQMFLLEVLSKLPSDYELLLVGPVAGSGPNKTRDSQYLEKIQEVLEKDASLGKRVKLIPKFVEAAEVFGIGDLYVLPAWNEGLGTPMLEALVSGMPVVANESEPAFQQWLSNCPIASLCPLIPERWAEEIQRLIATPEETRSDVSQKFSNEVSSYAIDTQYHKLLNLMNKADDNSLINIKEGGIGFEATS